MTTFVLVHGMAHGGWCWEKTRQGLTALGHRVETPDLPLTSLEADAAAVADVLDRVSGSVVLVGHSYGGLVISKAATGRKDVGRLVYVAAALLAADGVLPTEMADFPDAPLSSGLAINEEGIATVPEAVAIDCFYQDCTPEEARAAAAKLRPTSMLCVTSPPGGEPWRQIDSTYVRCLRDRAIVPELQAAMARRATRVIDLDTDHSPFMSMPEALLQALLAG